MKEVLSMLYEQQPDLKETQRVTDQQLEREKVMKEVIAAVKKHIDLKHPELKIASLKSQEKREELEKIVRQIVSQKKELSQDEKRRIIPTIVGFGFVETVLALDPTATDIRFNGTQVIIENPNKKYLYPHPVEEREVQALINRYANFSGDNFNKEHPNLPVQIGNVRVDAIHKSNAPYGTVLALRISRKNMVYSKDYFSIGPDSVRKLLLTFISSHLSIFVAGAVGSSKTELQKYLVEPIPFDETIFLIEEIPETHLKELYPDKDISSTSEQGGNMTISSLLKASKRQNATWVILTEVRSSEAYHLVQLLKSDHKVISTMHSKSVYTIPSTLTGMIAEHYPINEENYIRQIHESLDIGIQLSKRKINGKTYRWIKELCEYTKDGVQMIFSQRLNAKGELIATYYGLSENLKEIITDYGKESDIEDFEKECQEFHEKMGE